VNEDEATERVGAPRGTTATATVRVVEPPNEDASTAASSEREIGSVVGVDQGDGDDVAAAATSTSDVPTIQLPPLGGDSVKLPMPFSARKKDAASNDASTRTGREDTHTSSTSTVRDGGAATRVIPIREAQEGRSTARVIPLDRNEESKSGGRGYTPTNATPKP
jgi:hypothetical protein